MTSHRDAILQGVAAATKLHADLDVRSYVKDAVCPIDVFGAIEALGIPLLFQPLDNLLGSFVRVEGNQRGVLITTERDLHLQRFTAAHELGHALLGHEGSLDREVGYGPDGFAARDPQEVAADSFAAEFLLPRWLYIEQGKAHGWKSEHLRDPGTVYQLSLRTATSYEATCWGLLGQRILDQQSVARLRDTKPKESKLLALNGAPLPNPWADVWALGDRDDGRFLQAGPSDLVVVTLSERAGAGYLWDVQGATAAGFTVQADNRDAIDASSIGGPVVRRLVFQVPESGHHRLALHERRPWEANGPALRDWQVHLSTHGKEATGLSRRARASLAVA
jgi:Zn-dependent peptidase ImmA (M78 family)